MCPTTTVRDLCGAQADRIATMDALSLMDSFNVLGIFRRWWNLHPYLCPSGSLFLAAAGVVELT